MKLNIRFSAILFAALFAFGLSAQAHDRNPWLTAQALSMMGDASMPQIEHLKLEHWGNTHVKQLRMMGAEDQNGAYQALYQFDTEGNLDRIEMPKEHVTLLFAYTNQGQLRKIEALEKASKTAQINFYYDKSGALTRSVYDSFDSKTQTEVWYDDHDYPIMQHTFVKGKLTAQNDALNTYNSRGDILKQEIGKRTMSYMYNAEGNLIQIRTAAAGKTSQTDFAYLNGNIHTVKSYKMDGIEPKLVSTHTFAYDKTGRLLNESIVFPDPSLMPVARKYNYDETWELAASVRGDEAFDITYGYGTPVIIKWVTPEKNLRVTDSTQVLQLDLKPGVAQEMPEIVDITLRHNGKLTERKIGNVVLRKRGKGDAYYIEESLPMMVGPNQLSLEVETQLGRFSSDDRYITFRDPNTIVKNRNLHVLAIGISDYEVEGMDAKFADADARDFSQSLMAAEGKVFEKVEVKTLTNAEATRENIREALRVLKGKASEDDLAVVFFSGQGESFDGKYYLRSYDSGEDYLSLEASGIESHWLAEELNSFRSPVAAFLDASQHIAAGETPAKDLTSKISIVKDDFKDVVTDDEALRLVLIAAQGEQKSNESADWSNGIFTETLVAGLSGEGNVDRNNDGYITFDELTKYVKSEVKDRTDYKQAPTSFEAGIGKIPLGKK